MKVDATAERDVFEKPSILSKAFDLLRAFNSQDRVMTLSELARASGLAKSTVHRLLSRLISLGAVEEHRSGYKIGLGLLQLAAVTPVSRMRDYALPYLGTLHQQTGQTVHLGVLRGLDVVYLEKIARPDCPSRLSGVGSRLPANCTAIGKILLAYEDPADLESRLRSPLPRMTPYSIADERRLFDELRQIRQDGIARERNEAQLNLACVAVPIVVHKCAIAAVSVSFRAELGHSRGIDNALRETAARIAWETRAGVAAGRAHLLPRELLI